jgi:hypothetical protein
MLLGRAKAAMVGALSGILVAAGIALSATGASARSTYESPYGFGRTWNAAIRMVRVDNGWKITEKDEASGYLLFEYHSPESPKGTPGSIELVKGRESDAPISVLAQLPQMPQYHEQVLLDSLAAKMRREYGDPPQHKEPPPSQTPDASVGGDKD